MKTLATRKSQKGIIGSILLLATIIGLVLIIFVGRVVYNKFTDQEEIFSFNAFDHTFRMTQEQSLKSKIKEGMDKTIDAVEKGAKDAKEAAKEVIKERGVTEKIDEVTSKTKDIAVDTVNITDDEKKKITEGVTNTVSGVLDYMAETLDKAKKE